MEIETWLLYKFFLGELYKSLMPGCLCHDEHQHAYTDTKGQCHIMWLILKR